MSEAATPKYRVVRLCVDRFKRLIAVDITPGRNAVVVAGKNRAGKSSVLDAIYAALGGKKACPERPIHAGADSGNIVCVLGDDNNQLLVKRTFTDDGKTALEITSGEGFKAPSPQAILDGLTNQLAFDPAAFAQMKPDAQAGILKKLAGLDFEEIDTERKQLYEQRTALNRQIKTAEAAAQRITVPDGTPDGEQSIDDLVAELRDAETVNTANERQRSRLFVYEKEAVSAELHAERKLAEIATLEETLARARGELETLRERATTSRNHFQAQKEAADALIDADTEAIRAKITALQATNVAVALKAKRHAHLAEAREAQQAAATLTNQIADLDRTKTSQIEAAAWPIEGLSVDGETVLYNDLPLTQASGAEQLAVAFAIAAASNPVVCVALIRNASLLDDEQFAAVCRLAEQYDMQVWLERVDSEAGPCGILIEDGTAMPASENAEAPE